MPLFTKVSIIQSLAHFADLIRSWQEPRIFEPSHTLIGSLSFTDSLNVPPCQCHWNVCIACAVTVAMAHESSLSIWLLPERWKIDVVVIVIDFEFRNFAFNFYLWYTICLLESLFLLYCTHEYHYTISLPLLKWILFYFFLLMQLLIHLIC